MLTDTHVPDSDDWWLIRLANKLGEGLPRMEMLRQRRDGEALLPVDTWDKGTSENYMRFVRRSRLHVAETLRDSRTDRQKVVAFHTNVEGGEDGDLAAQTIWDRSRMDVQSVNLFNDIGDFGRAYITTTPHNGKAMWEVRNEWNTISEQHDRFPWLTRAAITVGYNAVLGTEEITLFRAGYFRVAYRETRIPTLPQDGSQWLVSNDWTWATAPIRTGSVDDPLVTQFSTTDGYGIYEKHLDTLDRINEITLNGLTLIVMQAFRQRAVSTDDLPDYYPEGHPQAGQLIDYDEVFRTGPAALWTLPVNAKMWESTPADPRPIYEARRDELKHLCTITRTPMSLFDSSNANQSALGSQISHQPLIKAVEKMNRMAGPGFAQSMSQSFKIEGDTERADYASLRTEFGKVNPSTMAEKAEAAPKFKAGNAPQSYIDAEVFEMTPAQRRRANIERVEESFNRALAEDSSVNDADR
ncbi:hypothetical protein [Microbacterium sp. YY-01]|uniref:hypothetical protein n=1 Tax=Microbacterium sp. YY-01 TaxID=3421634 RepID=UPI003D175FD2